MDLIIGIDISKSSFDAAILGAAAKPARKKFANKLSGFSELNLLVQGWQPKSVTLAMEATGPYGQALALFCFNLGWTVFVLNPARIKAFGVAVGQRNKTDRADALTIALFAQKTDGLMPWTPATPARALLRELVRERLHVQRLLLAENARALTGQAAREMIARRVKLLEEQKQELWQRIRQAIKEEKALAEDAKLVSSIPGVGAWSAAFLLSELPVIDKKTNARQVAALFGLCPRNVESGSSVRAPARVSRQGRRGVSHQLYMPAMSALKFNPLIKSWADGLEERGKTGKMITCAVIHKLVRIAVGVLKTRQAFDPHWKGARV